MKQLDKDQIKKILRQMNPNKNQPKQGSFDPRKGKQGGDNQGGNYEFLSKTQDSNVT